MGDAVGLKEMSGAVDNPWALGLVGFLRENREVEAVRVNRGAHTVEMATLGPADAELLGARLTETIRRIGEGAGGVAGACSSVGSVGILFREDGEEVRVERPTCPTGLMLWRWQEVDWPEAAEEEGRGEEWRMLAVLAAVCGVLGLAGFVLSQFAGVPGWVPIALYVAAMVAGGWDALVDVKESLPKGKLDIHFLMLAVAVGASAIGAWAEGALLLFLFSFSGALEHFALHRTRREIDGLFDGAPRTANVLGGDGEERPVPVEEVAVREVVLVRPGEQFPVDAEVLDGKTAADESNLTGEAHPVSKERGDLVFSGTMNLWGAVRARVLRPAAESALQKVIRLIREAQHLKAPSQRFTDRFGTGYTIGILVLTGVMFAVWWLGFGVRPFANTAEGYSAFYRAMTLLVVASPCALVLSIPSAILAAIAWGARHGILFRGGAAIEKLAEVDLVALDKTGTLTTGDMEVTRVESFPPGREREVAELAYSLENHGAHPIGRAIRRHGKREGLVSREVADFRALPGRGIQGRAGGAACVLGRRELLAAGPLAGWASTLPEPPREFIENWVIHEELIGRILLKDRIRTASKPILEEMSRRGLRSVMLTGDRREAAEAVARELGIEEVRSGLSPEDKVAAVREFGRAGHKVAMVGDGVNDAPSLAAAHVSVAMGARGSDAALEQSEVVLMNDRIDNFLAARRLSERARKVIRQNLGIALGTVVLMAGAAIFGLIPLSVGVFAHEGSTVVVCLNSLRLLFASPAMIESSRRPSR